MLTAVWLSYAALLLAGVAYYAARASERVFERITVPQLLYLMYLLVLVVFSGYALRSLWLAAAFGLPALGLCVWVGLAEAGIDVRRARDAFQADVAACRRALDADPNDILALEGLASTYEKFGAASLAEKYLSRLLALYDKGGKSEMGRARSATEARLDRLRSLGSACAANPDLPVALKACGTCEYPVLRESYDCPRCGAGLFPARTAWFAALAGRAIERNGLLLVTGAGAAFLPFLFECGIAAYSVLWVVWALIFVTSKKEPRPLGVDPVKDSAPAFVLAALLACLLAGLAAYSAPGRFVVEAKAPSARSGAQAKKRLEEQYAALGVDPRGPDVTAAVAGFVKALSSPDRDERFFAAAQLSSPRYAANARSAVPALERALGDADADVREAAGRALAKIRYCENNEECRRP